ncbi:hypothetical protein AEP_02577 [Curvibacter sp. AEP1-3]|uniref:hypothetical protein n=1 Tax=Curvibacter sp. AEP1-3 TaxID=1844971 RepID=UPI000B3CF7F3|nr:hypothetical protein [Curvibacter sp. AEP1-3]ARV19503.1 hypothetical protein AEP_02577 [Curvibacter sp. AEP1-3]
MITSSDPEYGLTKKIKQGKSRMSTHMDELARWIEATWNVVVLNVIFDEPHRGRLQIILEHPQHVAVFSKEYNFDEVKTNAIANKFGEVCMRHSVSNIRADKPFVVFSAFSPIARAETDNKISDADIAALIQRIGNKDLWEISRFFGHVTFFFFTDEQKEKNMAEGKKCIYAKMYFDLLILHDEFGYLSNEEFTVSFDSKHNFDKNYQSNWYYYYK